MGAAAVHHNGHNKLQGTFWKRIQPFSTNVTELPCAFPKITTTTKITLTDKLINQYQVQYSLILGTLPENYAAIKFARDIELRERLIMLKVQSRICCGQRQITAQSTLSLSKRAGKVQD